jgi:putative spermidine/putrescine transport system ATP-binding protein
VRPEKVYVADPEEPLASDVHSALGTVREVVYVGSGTRYVVDLDAGGSLVALQQNLRTSSMDVLAMRGKKVRLVWRKEHEYRVGT